MQRRLPHPMDSQINSNAKTPEEILSILKAEAMGDEVFTHILDYIKPGMTENDVAAEIAATFEKLGSEGFAFPTICVSGERTELPHGEPTDRIINEGEFLTIDMGGIVNGYCGDMTRTVAIGHVTEEMQKVYDTVLASQLAGLKALKVGASCFDVDRVCREIINDAGYGEYFVHGTGHGVGREVHEKPYLNTRTDEVLEADVAVTVEPGIYIPGQFGVRIEDLAIVTDFGIINAAKSEKNLIVL
jgi:Xaa-Pro aminopeptidase